MPTVSVGVTLGRDSKADVHDLLSIVDRALYRAKELGRNRVETEVPEGQSTQNAMLAAPSIVPIIGRDRAASTAAPVGWPRRAAS